MAAYSSMHASSMHGAAMLACSTHQHAPCSTTHELCFSLLVAFPFLAVMPDLPMTQQYLKKNTGCCGEGCAREAGGRGAC